METPQLANSRCGEPFGVMRMWMYGYHYTICPLRLCPGKRQPKTPANRVPAPPFCWSGTCGSYFNNIVTLGISWILLRTHQNKHLKDGERKVLRNFAWIGGIWTLIPALVFFGVPVAYSSGRHMGNIIGVFFVFPVHILFLLLGFAYSFAHDSRNWSSTSRWRWPRSLARFPPPQFSRYMDSSSPHRGPVIFLTNF